MLPGVSQTTSCWRHTRLFRTGSLAQNLTWCVLMSGHSLSTSSNLQHPFKLGMVASHRDLVRPCLKTKMLKALFVQNFNILRTESVQVRLSNNTEKKPQWGDQTRLSDDRALVLPLPSATSGLGVKYEDTVSREADQQGCLLKLLSITGIFRSNRLHGNIEVQTHGSIDMQTW